MFLQYPSKFGDFMLKIGGEIICQSWLLLTLSSQLVLVHCISHMLKIKSILADNTDDTDTDTDDTDDIDPDDTDDGGGGGEESGEIAPLAGGQSFLWTDSIGLLL